MNISFTSEHENPKDSQLLVAITGTPEYIKEQLQNLIEQCNGSYGKPRQGRISGCGGYINIITPVWKGQEYQ